VTEQEAAAEARQRNLEMGRVGVTDRFFIEVQRDGDDWTVEERLEKRTWRNRVLEALFASSGSGSSGPNV
jgi:hypothetical protein